MSDSMDADTLRALLKAGTCERKNVRGLNETYRSSKSIVQRLSANGLVCASTTRKERPPKWLAAVVSLFAIGQSPAVRRAKNSRPPSQACNLSRLGTLHSQHVLVYS